MKLTLWAAAIGALLAVPFSALAQQSTTPADPADPRAAVPPVKYESAIASAPMPRQDSLTPDKAWRAANDAVAGAEGHAGHDSAKAPQGHAQHAQSASSPSPAPTVKAVEKPTVDHSKHN